jgi:hypothetical protein
MSYEIVYNYELTYNNEKPENAATFSGRSD